MKIKAFVSLCNTGQYRQIVMSTVLAIAGLGANYSAHAAEWSSTNIQLLHGTDYALIPVGEEKKAIITVEHANGWKYGDNFFFMDIAKPTAKGTSHYGEYSPRLSFGKISGKDFSFGVVKDFLLAGTLEVGDGVHATLLGLGIDLKLPGFAFTQLNIYARKSERDFAATQTDAGGQVTLAWKLPFEVSTQKLAFEGFADYAFGEDSGSNPKEDNLVAAPRLLIDVGNWFGVAGALQAGVEYQIWRNKFGVDGVDEDAVQAMVKWIF